jgi:hypothetical protein
MIVFQMNIRIITRAREIAQTIQGVMNMTNREDNKLSAEKTSEANPEDLQVQDVAEDNVKGGRVGLWEYRVAATGEVFNG